MTENGWPPDTNKVVAISLNDCDLVTILGTGGKLKLWFQKGIPAKMLPTFMADLNEFIEPAYNSRGYTDEGSWTNGNSVKSSNHNGATAFDYNWDDHPMGEALAGWGGSVLIDGPQEPYVRELLKFYTYKGIQMVWWANDWDSPKDSMHFQMGYNTYQNQDICWEFINKFFRPDGLSVYRRGGTSIDGTVYPVGYGTKLSLPTGTSEKVALLARATGLSTQRAAQILPNVIEGLRLSECTSNLRASFWLAQVGHESDNFNARAEYGRGAGKPYYPYFGRTWIQITWQSNYLAFGKWCVAKSLIFDPNYFVNNPNALEDERWEALGPAQFWTTPHSGHNMINDDCDANDFRAVTYTINGGYNNYDDRVKRLDRCKNLDLMPLLEEEEDWMSDPEIVRKINEIHAALFNKIKSQSRYITDGEGAIWELHELIKNDDGMVHESYVERLAVLGDPDNVALVYRQCTRNDTIAQSVMLRIDDKFLDADQKYMKNLITINRFQSGSNNVDPTKAGFSDGKEDS